MPQLGPNLSNLAGTSALVSLAPKVSRQAMAREIQGALCPHVFSRTGSMVTGSSAMEINRLRQRASLGRSRSSSSCLDSSQLGRCSPASPVTILLNLAEAATETDSVHVVTLQMKESKSMP